jgi:hypothetical protein
MKSCQFNNRKISIETHQSEPIYHLIEFFTAIAYGNESLVQQDLFDFFSRKFEIDNSTIYVNNAHYVSDEQAYTICMFFNSNCCKEFRSISKTLYEELSVK